jgi:hypothetical protein
VQAGERSQAESGIATIRKLAASVPQPLIAYTRLRLESSWALLEGDLQAAEQWAVEAQDAGPSSGVADAVATFGGQLARIRYFQGRFGELAEQTLEFAGEPDSLTSWRAAAASALIQGGRSDEARELALTADFQSARWDETWFIAMHVWAEVCSHLPVVDRAGELYELLAPFSGQFVAGGSIVSGSADSALGALATALGRYEDAEVHFAAAAEIEERLRAPLFLARTHLYWAKALIARGRPEDLDRAHPLLQRAEDSAGRLGAEGITREIPACRIELAAAGG